MNNSLEIIIPVYNEGKNIIKVFDHLQINIKNKFIILLCYDHEDDDLFLYLNELKKKNINFKLIKNKFFGPGNALYSIIKIRQILNLYI